MNVEIYLYHILVISFGPLLSLCKASINIITEKLCTVVTCILNKSDLVLWRVKFEYKMCIRDRNYYDYASVHCL